MLIMRLTQREMPSHDEQRPFCKTAPHIRGRVFKRGRTWYMQVINTRTGKVVASDNTGYHDVMVADCHMAVAATRGAWTYALRREDLL